MAEELATLPKVPALPTKGRIGMAEALGVQEPFIKAKSELQPQIRDAEGDVLKAKQAQAETLAAGKSEAMQKYGTETEAAQKTYEGKLEAEPLPAFIPTKDTMQDIAGLFSVISVIGALVGGSGKMAAQRAMGAMNGMMEGYRKGRADLYKQERNQFDANFKTMIQKHTEFRKEMEDAVKLAATNKEAGQAAAELAAAKAGSPIIQAMVRQGRLVDSYKTMDESQNGVKDAVKMEQKARAEEEKARQHRADMAQRERQQRETMAQRERLAKEKTAASPRGGAAQETALRVMQQDIGNAKYNLEDLKNLSEKKGKLPGGSVAFAQKFTGDISSMLMRYAANQNIDEGLQANDALMLNLAFDIASAQSGGRGQLSDAKVRAVVSQMPLDEQPENTKATKWAALMTRVDEANKTLPSDRQVEIPENLRKYYMGSRTESSQPGGHWEYRDDPNNPGKQQRRWVNG
jgi:hypothetical protein